MLWLLILPVAMVFVAYQAYVSEREKHERLELLYQSSRILQHSPEIDSTLVVAAEPRADDVPGRARGGRPVPAEHRRGGLRTAVVARRARPT